MIMLSFRSLPIGNRITDAAAVVGEDTRALLLTPANGKKVYKNN
jgi:hypothetical protein